MSSRVEELRAGVIDISDCPDVSHCYVYLASKVDPIIEELEDIIAGYNYVGQGLKLVARDEIRALKAKNAELEKVLKEKEFNAVKGQVFEVIDCRIEDLKREKQQLIEALDTQKKLNASLEAENARLRAEIEDCRYGDDCGGLGLFHGD